MSVQKILRKPKRADFNVDFVDVLNECAENKTKKNSLN